MKLPKVQDFKLAEFDLVQATATQIQKDWLRTGLSPLPFDKLVSANQLIDILEKSLNELVLENLEVLPTLLYLIDLNEEKLQWQRGELTIEILTLAIVKREFYKVLLRSSL